MKDNYIVVIRKSKIDKLTPRQLLRELKNVRSNIICKDLLRQAYIIGKQALLLNDLDIVLMLLLNKNGFGKVISNFLGKQKERLIQKTIKQNRAFAIPKQFYLVSKHTDCADDHAKWQGKIYIDKDYDKDDLFIKDYIEKNDVKTIQWVIDKPVYMFTRPNCRHKFVALTKSQVFSCDIPTLLEKHDLIEKYDRTKNKEQVYRKRIDNYNRKLKLYKQLVNIYNTPKLTYLINRAKLTLKRIKL